MHKFVRRMRKAAAAHWVSPQIRRLAIGVVGLVCALILGLAWTVASRAAQDDGRSPLSSYGAKPPGGTGSDHVSKSAPSQHGSLPCSSPRLPRRSRTASSDDPNDDETSPDPFDDNDSCDDPSVGDETHVPIAWHAEMFQYTSLSDAASAPAWTDTSCPRFLTLQHFRC